MAAGGAPRGKAVVVDMSRFARRLAALGLSLLAAAGAGCGRQAEPEVLPGTVPEAMDFEPGTAPQMDPPPLTEGIFPCTGCHDASLPPNPKPRKLTLAHDDIVLKHDEKHRWCLDCHDANNRDKLHLSSGELVDFTESYRLCGQCHGDKYRDWRAGVHGRRTGHWDGEKKYLLCVSCHYSHAPRFKPLKPEPPPNPPRRQP